MKSHFTTRSSDLTLSMPLQLCVNDSSRNIPFVPDMLMGQYIRDVIAPALGLPSADTVPVKVHTPDLRVVFQNACRLRRVGDLLTNGSVLVVSQWPRDPSTVNSLIGNASLDETS